MKARHKDTGEIIEIAEQGIISHDGRRFCWNQVELIPEPIDEFKPSLPSNLDEAAKEYLREYNESEFGNGGDDWDDDIVITFKAGAEWMAGQSEVLITETVDELCYDCHNHLPELIEKTGLSADDRVELIVRKI